MDYVFDSVRDIGKILFSGKKKASKGEKNRDQDELKETDDLTSLRSENVPDALQWEEDQKFKLMTRYFYDEAQRQYSYKYVVTVVKCLLYSVISTLKMRMVVLGIVLLFIRLNRFGVTYFTVDVIVSIWIANWFCCGCGGCGRRNSKFRSTFEYIVFWENVREKLEFQMLQIFVLVGVGLTVFVLHLVFFIGNELPTNDLTCATIHRESSFFPGGGGNTSDMMLGEFEEGEDQEGVNTTITTLTETFGILNLVYTAYITPFKAYPNEITTCEVTNDGFIEYYKGFVLSFISFFTLIFITTLGYDGPSCDSYCSQLRYLQQHGVLFPDVEISIYTMLFRDSEAILSDIVTNLYVLKQKDVRNLDAFQTDETVSHMDFSPFAHLDSYDLGFLTYFFVDHTVVHQKKKSILKKAQADLEFYVEKGRKKGRALRKYGKTLDKFFGFFKYDFDLANQLELFGVWTQSNKSGLKFFTSFLLITVIAYGVGCVGCELLLLTLRYMKYGYSWDVLFGLNALLIRIASYIAGFLLLCLVLFISFLIYFIYYEQMHEYWDMIWQTYFTNRFGLHARDSHKLHITEPEKEVKNKEEEDDVSKTGNDIVGGLPEAPPEPSDILSISQALLFLCGNIESVIKRLKCTEIPLICGALFIFVMTILLSIPAVIVLGTVSTSIAVVLFLILASILLITSFSCFCCVCCILGQGVDENDNKCHFYFCSYPLGHIVISFAVVIISAALMGVLAFLPCYLSFRILRLMKSCISGILDKRLGGHQDENTKKFRKDNKKKLEKLFFEHCDELRRENKITPSLEGLWSELVKNKDFLRVLHEGEGIDFSIKDLPKRFKKQKKARMKKEEFKFVGIFDQLWNKTKDMAIDTIDNIDQNLDLKLPAEGNQLREQFIDLVKKQRTDESTDEEDEEENEEEEARNHIYNPEEIERTELWIKWFNFRVDIYKYSIKITLKKIRRENTGKLGEGKRKKNLELINKLEEDIFEWDFIQFFLGKWFCSICMHSFLDSEFEKDQKRENQRKGNKKGESEASTDAEILIDATGEKKLETQIEIEEKESSTIEVEEDEEKAKTSSDVEEVSAEKEKDTNDEEQSGDDDEERPASDTDGCETSDYVDDNEDDDDE